MKAAITSKRETITRVNTMVDSSTGKILAARSIKKGEEVTYDPSMMERKILAPSANLRGVDKIDGQRFNPAAWGLLSSIDLEDCNPDLIRDADAIRNYVYELCDLIEMKRFGECHVVFFGEDEKVAGYSMFQLIETSCISAHFANETNTSYIDIFSCKAYDPYVAAEFTKKFFQGGVMRVSVTNRF